MGQLRLLWMKAARRPLLSAWLLFFVFAVAMALLLQLVVLPFWFTELHAGNGLLVGGDWVGFHVIAVDLSQKILSQGWSVWELSPQGHPPAGIAAALYALTVPQPYVLIPLNAALHATGGIALMAIVRLLSPTDRGAFCAALPFVLFPSGMAWYAQLHKDGFYFTGAFLCLYGWIVLARLQTWQSGWRSVFAGLIWLGLGLGLMGSVRVYAFQLMQGVGVLFTLGLAALFAVRGAKGLLPWKKCVMSVLILCLIPILLQFSPTSVRGSTALPDSGTGVPRLSWHGSEFAKDRWKPTADLPRFVENSFLRIAVLRSGYFSTPGYRESGSMVDRDIELLSVRDFLTYLPRALQLGFFAPFPSDWLEPAKSVGGNVMRKVAGVEMTIVYLAITFLPYALWCFRFRVEVWVAFAFGVVVLLLYSYATPNIGSLYRLRFGFLMLLVALGVAGAFGAWRDFRQSSRFTFISKANSK